ncbi:MAG: nitrous oxide reductase accessory protein NosL [Luteolibacter sp.]|jgi:copper chaperone NosL|nr:nitrous oxide reductase accessory protein NosL [Luteolibacter sp.]
MKRLHIITRILLALAVLSLLAGYYLPMWEIQLWAPQYPEGLNMKIWLDHLSGDFDIINGLNHYIGMKLIKEEMFPEFQYMGYALGLLIFMGLLPVIIGRGIFLGAFVAILFIAGGLGIYDFHRWGHDYGHNLDPKAAISVPGMTYDPPIIGYKNLLNFTAYSGPDKGGWILIGAGGTAVALLAWELWRTRRRKNPVGNLAKTALLLPLLLFLPGCDPKPQPIEYGLDACAECNMTIVNKHFGSEFVTGKGKVFKFDDLNCMVEFIGREPHASDSRGMKLVIDFHSEGSFLHADEAVLLQHRKFRSPMRGDVAAFSNQSAADAVSRELGEGGRSLTWSDVLKSFQSSRNP